MTISRFIHVAVNGIISFFLWLRNIPLYVCMYVCVYIYIYIYICPASSSFVPLSMDIGGLYVLAVVDSAAMNIGVHVSFQIMFFSGYMPRSGIAGPEIRFLCGILVLGFLPFVVSLGAQL